MASSPWMDWLFLNKAPYAAGKLRALAVAGDRRAKALPDTPSVAEAGYPAYEANTGMGLLRLPGRRARSSTSSTLRW